MDSSLKLRVAREVCVASYPPVPHCRIRNGNSIAYTATSVILATMAEVEHGESAVARELWQRLLDARDRQGLIDRDVAAALHVTASNLSKHVRDTSTTPSDDWIALVAEFTKMSIGDTAILLARAGLERAKAAPPNVRDRLASSWTYTQDHLNWPQIKLPSPHDRDRLFLDAFKAIGIDVRRGDVLKKVVEFANRTVLDEAKYGELVSLFEQVSDHSTTPGTSHPTFGAFLDELRRRLSVRRFPLASRIPASSPTTTLPGRQINQKSVPVLPGVLMHFVSAREGATIPRHTHDGIEAILVLSGQVRVRFDNELEFELDAQSPELVIYEATVPHEGIAISDAAVVIIHYSPKLQKKWDVVIRAYQDEIGGSS